MEAMLSQHRILAAITAFAVGVAVSLLIHTPFGLLAPVVLGGTVVRAARRAAAPSDVAVAR